MAAWFRRWLALKYDRLRFMVDTVKLPLIGMNRKAVRTTVAIVDLMLRIAADGRTRPAVRPIIKYRATASRMQTTNPRIAVHVLTLARADAGELKK
jgi:hypothetical protein